MPRLGGSQEESKQYSSRVPDRQIKSILYLEALKVLERILRQLEKAIRGRDISSWPQTFASIVLLCFSMEIVHSQAATYVSTSLAMSKVPNFTDPDHHYAAVKHGIDICETLERNAFAQ